MSIEIRRAGELTAAELYDLLRLRTDVFVVEQECAYPELDGRDLLAETVHLWVTEEGELLGTIRILHADGGRPIIGRVATARSARGRGIAARLMERGLALCGPTVEIELHAQAHLEDWYGRFGFVRDGEGYLEDDIAHVPMLRPAAPA